MRDRSHPIWLLRILILTLLTLAVGACAAGPDSFDIERIRQHRENADRAILAGDYATAEQETRNALAIATETGYEDGMIPEHLSLGTIYLVTKRFDLAEKEYLEAIEICRNNSRCSWMDNAYGHLLFLYAYAMRNPEKAVAASKELKLYIGRPGNDIKTVNEQLRDCAGLLRSAGLPEAAAEVDDLIDSGSGR